MAVKSRQQPAKQQQRGGEAAAHGKHLTEDEQIALALAASMEQGTSLSIVKRRRAHHGDGLFHGARQVHASVHMRVHAYTPVCVLSTVKQLLLLRQNLLYYWCCNAPVLTGMLTVASQLSTSAGQAQPSSSPADDGGEDEELDEAAVYAAIEREDQHRALQEQQRAEELARPPPEKVCALMDLYLGRMRSLIVGAQAVPSQGGGDTLKV
eukprot:scaffold5282_cov20-Tisochrysis_lutea.AAC.1